MLRKIVTVLLLLCLMTNFVAMAENTSEQSASAFSDGAQGVPQEFQRMPGGEGASRGFSSPAGKFTPPEGFTPPAGEFTPPEGLTPPSGEFTPPSGEFGMPRGEQTSKGSAPAPSVTPAPITDTASTPLEVAEEPAENSHEETRQNPSFGGQNQQGMNRFQGGMQGFSSGTQHQEEDGFIGFLKTYATPVTAVVLLGLAFVFVLCYKRKNY